MNSLEGDSEFPGDGASSPGARGGQNTPKAVQGHSLSEASEAQIQAVLGDLESSMKSKQCLRNEVNPLASPGKGRRDLTISSLIAECEEYVKTDEFTKDLSDNLVHLFSQNKGNPSHDVSSTKTHTEPESCGSVSKSRTEKVSKPPKVPENLRSKLNGKSDAVIKHETLPKFPVALRSSTYDNVATQGVDEVEDEGIDNDYDEAEVGEMDTGESGNMVRCGSQEGSPALTSEGYDSAHESGQERDYLLINGALKFPEVMCNTCLLQHHISIVDWCKISHLELL